MAKKIFLILAALMIVAGLALFVLTMAANHWSFTTADEASRKTAACTAEEYFNNIRIDTETADIVFALSTDGTCRVEYTESEDKTYTVAVVSDTLTVQSKDTRKWYQFFSFGSDETVTVYLPRAEFDALEIEESTGDIEIPKGFAFADISIETGMGDVSCRAVSEEMTIVTSTGNITVADVSADSITLSASTGRVKLANVSCVRDLSIAVSTGRTELENVQCGNFISTGSTGGLVMTDVIALGKLSVKRSTGDVEFDRCDAVDISVETSTGDVTGTLLTDKIFFTDTNTGDVDVPKTTTGGTCEITTTTGDIAIKIG